MTTGVEVIRSRVNPFYLSSDDILSGEVETYADLPTYANVGDVFLVKTTTGIIGNRKLAGLYVWDGLVWNPIPTAMKATNIYYDNTASGLAANTTQLAIDELTSGSKHVVSASFNGSDGVLTLTLNDTSEITTTINFDGLNVGFSGTITNNRIKVGDTSFYIDRGNSNLPLINWDSNDYIAYNRTNDAFSLFINGFEELKLTSGANYPTLTMRGEAVLNQADRTIYGSGYDLDNFKACGIYVIGSLMTNLPPQRDPNESSYVLHVYTWGGQNGIQILYCTDRDAANKHNAIYSRCWESTLWTDWNCVSSTPEELCDIVVSIGLTYTNFTVNEALSTIATRYKQVLIMYESSAYSGSMILDGPTIDINQNWEIGKYSTRSINFKTPTSSSSTTWQAAASGVTLTRIKMVGYR